VIKIFKETPVNPQGCTSEPNSDIDPQREIKKRRLGCKVKK